jgi:hypothetical protein
LVQVGAGIYFRGGEKAFAAKLWPLPIVDSGGDKGVAIDVTGESEGVVIDNNDLKETRSPHRGSAFASAPRRAILAVRTIASTVSRRR